MKVKRTGLRKIPAAEVSQIIISIWHRIGAASAGEPELLEIQAALEVELSPARIARELAAAGVELRHPEVIECDARWRDQRIAKRSGPLARLARLQNRAPLSLTAAQTTIAKLEALRLRLTAEADEVGLQEIKELAIDVRRSALRSANDESLSALLRDEQAEIAEWFRVWLETPHLFAQWVDLRKASAVFADKFAAG